MNFNYKLKRLYVFLYTHIVLEELLLTYQSIEIKNKKKQTKGLSLEKLQIKLTVTLVLKYHLNVTVFWFLFWFLFVFFNIFTAATFTSPAVKIKLPMLLVAKQQGAFAKLPKIFTMPPSLWTLQWHLMIISVNITMFSNTLKILSLQIYNH